MNDQWLKRWEEGRISFHEGIPNELLTKHHSKLNLGRDCLVPLCGKAVDILWLNEKKHTVTGVELPQKAIDQFFSEHSFSESHRPHLIQADFFEYQPNIQFDWIYDRAALIALPPHMRKKYVLHQKSLLKEKASIVLISIEYESTELKGPPFSVSANEIRDLYAFARDIQLIETRDPIDSVKHLQDKVLWIRESIWKIET